MPRNLRCKLPWAGRPFLFMKSSCQIPGAASVATPAPQTQNIPPSRELTKTDSRGGSSDSPLLPDTCETVASWGPGPWKQGGIPPPGSISWFLRIPVSESHWGFRYMGSCSVILGVSQWLHFNKLTTSVVLKALDQQYHTPSNLLEMQIFRQDPIPNESEPLKLDPVTCVLTSLPGQQSPTLLAAGTGFLEDSFLRQSWLRR